MSIQCTTVKQENSETEV